MKVLVLDRILPGADPSTIGPLLPEEARYAAEKYLGGVIREWYFRQDRPGAVLILECDSAEQAQALMNEFPLAKAGLVAFDVIPLGPYMPLGILLGIGGGSPPAH